jgi:hypothetical protein
MLERHYGTWRRIPDWVEHQAIKILHELGESSCRISGPIAGWLVRSCLFVNRKPSWLASAHGDELYGHSNRQEQEAIVGICTRTFRFDCMVKVEFCWTIIASVSLALPCLRKRASLEYRNRERGLVNNTMYAKFQDFGYQLPYNSIK